MLEQSSKAAVNTALVIVIISTLTVVGGVYSQQRNTDNKRGKVNNQLVGFYWDYYGTSELELESNGEYRFTGRGGSNFRKGSWGAEGNTLYFDGKPCRYTYGRNNRLDSTELNIQCGDGSVVDRTWTRKPNH